MQLLWSLSPELGADAEETMVRRFIEASRRAEIVTLVNAAASAGELAATVSEELCEALEAESAFVLGARAGWTPPELVGSHGVQSELQTRLLHDPSCVGALGADDTVAHSGEDLLGVGIRNLVLSPFVSETDNRCVVGVGRWHAQQFDPAEVALLRSVTASIGHALERTWLEEDRRKHAARQAALVRAAKQLNQSLELDEVLQALCKEVAAALGSDTVTVYFGDGNSGLEAVAAHGLPEEFLGFVRAPGEGLCGRVIVTGRPQRSSAYAADGNRPATSRALDAISCGLSVPLHRHGGLDGALSVGFHTQRWIADEDVELLGGFAELASVACRNAAHHAEARRDATVDSLTGCLNHAAMQSRVREEISRAERSDAPLSIAMLDLNDFGRVNDEHGHLVGDTVLRAVADALRSAMRLHDQVARYGGDEFIAILPDADSIQASALAARIEAALEQVHAPAGWTASAAIGLASWQPGESATSLLSRADANARAAKGNRTRAAAAGEAEIRSSPEPSDPARSRRLLTAVRIGAKLSRLLEPSAIARTVIEDLHGTLGYERCAIMRLDADEAFEVAAAGAPMEPAAPRPGVSPDVVSSCLKGRRAVLDAHSSGDTGSTTAQLAVPLFSGARLWGALHVRAAVTTPLDNQEVNLVHVVADHIGSALTIADLYAELESSSMGTAEALAAALEAKDHYTADHARSIADLAGAVGTRLGLDPDSLRDVRYGAIFHDIGKIAVPDAILNKPAPLTPHEFEVVKQHPVVGEQILGSVPFLANVRRIVRHGHERWDGTGYPDGLRGQDIPIGARIVFGADAYHAMVSDRAYRPAMPVEAAIEELRANAGTQFDPTVIETLTEIIER